ncbi:hypothetical protein [Yoonia sediminilitoris]|uniref:Uncharacterized protein n=1 Tax=Yoonia sediminilitoris TaxID=1286148 RepID=A0A2T6KS65_9RHOB|nr:hypothetical protein [Yoonia sediminilitoris]PUB19398.1 hypothetical protein C8N45_101996 [Yoonia sediminilitoris]RCW99566.1 hypothetical protein DFP92_101996 [Yoonia sediminilitoris]
MKFLLTVIFGMILGSAATFYYIYQNHADASEQALMRDTLTTYLPFMEEYINP